MTDEERLARLIRSRHSAVWLSTSEEADALWVVAEAAMATGRPLWVWSVVQGVKNGLLADSPAVPETENPILGLHRLGRAAAGSGTGLGEAKGVILCTLDLADHLDDARVLRVLRETMAVIRKRNGTLVMIDHRSKLPDAVRAHVTPFELSLPDEAELERLIRSTLRREHATSPIDVKLKKDHLAAIVRNLMGLTRRQAEQVIMDVVCSDRTFDESDLAHILAQKRVLLSGGGLLEFVEAPVSMDEIGGIRRLKQWLAAREGALSDAGREYGLDAPRGVLMLGVQGAGKSLCAKAIATAWQRPLLRMDVGALYDRYVGESERRLRDALHQAEAMAPIVLWIDEVEKAFASAAAQSTDGGLSKRMFGTLLTWMQEHEKPVFLVATANDIEALPPELLRKGRFDEIFFVDLPDTAVRRKIFEIHLRKRKRDPSRFDLERLAAESDGFSGAEIEQAVIGALHQAFSSGKELDTDTIVAVVRSSPPLSVTMKEKIDWLREWARERCVPAD